MSEVGRSTISMAAAMRSSKFPEQDRFCEIAAYLHQVRLDQGLTITDVAQRSSLAPAFIQAIECCDFRNLPEAWPSGICIQRYADALGLKGSEVSSGLSRRASAR